jgi:hypothetical protein
MDIFEWLLLISGNEAQAAQLLKQLRSVNDFLFILYILASLVIRQPVYLLAYFFSMMLFNLALFDPLQEYQLYLITFCLYSYVFQTCPTDKSKIGCSIILIITVFFALDALFYGVNGFYGERKTFIWQNIEYIALFAHIFFIYTLVPFRRIRNSLRSFFDSIMHITRNSAFFVVI